MEGLAGIERVVAKLREQEGGIIHRNKGELDITSTCGVYRHSHPDAEIFKYLDELARDLGIAKPSANWTKEDIDKINQNLDLNKEFHLNVDFYKTYIKVVNLSLLPSQIVFAFFSLYTNGNKLACESLQRSCNLLLNKHASVFNNDSNGNRIYKDLVVDGKIGSGSRGVIYHIADIISHSDQSELYGEIWRSYFLHAAKTAYVKIGTTDVAKTGTDKDIKYLRGWINRCDELLEEDI